jgi:hypothetical protein
LIWAKSCGILAERTGCLSENTEKKKALFKIGKSSFTSAGKRHAVSRRLESKHSSTFIFRTLGLLDPEDENNCEAFEALRPTTRRHSQEDLNLQEHRFENLQCRINESHCLPVCNIVEMKAAGSSETSVHIYQTTRRYISADSDLTAMKTFCIINVHWFSERSEGGKHLFRYTSLPYLIIFIFSLFLLPSSFSPWMNHVS